MQEIPFNQVKITDDFWSPRLEMNNTHALLHQWQQLEKSGCIDNFRLLADPNTQGVRKGWFFADSDAYKWLEAAVIGYAQSKDPVLKTKIESFISLLQSVQEPDGYLYTYNQLIFPDSRWENLQIEHELYCHGHLIEAAVSHFLVTADTSLLNIAIKAANLLVDTFLGKGTFFTPGHEEIEIALLRLYDVTKNKDYLQLAHQFLHQRGRHKPLSFMFHMLAENQRVDKRTKHYQQTQKSYELAESDQKTLTQVPPPNKVPPVRFAKTRFMLSALNGKYFQQHRPLDKQNVPVGHSVRFAYLQSAATKYARLETDNQWDNTLQKSWQHMVSKRMAVTGGIGSLPYSEGFGRDYELNPAIMYAETCAALGCMFWNWEMTLLTQQAAYADLFERQLYNASLVGIGQQGNCYLYNNPLESHYGMQRQPWFEIPCCPSNLSRTWGKLGGYLSSFDNDQVWIHQLIGASWTAGLAEPVSIRTESQLPWQGTYSLTIKTKHPQRFALHIRIPSWVDNYKVFINQQEFVPPEKKPSSIAKTAHGYDPNTAFYITVEREWHPDDSIRMELQMPIQINKVHPKVKSTAGKVAISRGPLVYCLEGLDNPGMDLKNVVIQSSSLVADYDQDLLGGIMTIKGKTTNDQPVKLIPYAWWANREASPMTVFVKLSEF